MHDPQGAHRFHDKIVEFVGVRTTAGPGDRFATIYAEAIGIHFDEVVIASFLDLLRYLRKCLIPADVFPGCAACPAHLWPQNAPVVDDVLFERGTLRAECAAIGGVVGVAFDVYHLRRDVLRAIPNGINDGATADRAVWTCRPRFAGPGDLDRKS